MQEDSYLTPNLPLKIFKTIRNVQSTRRRSPSPVPTIKNAPSTKIAVCKIVTKRAMLDSFRSPECGTQIIIIQSELQEIGQPRDLSYIIFVLMHPKIRTLQSRDQGKQP
jgi:hypothetical protein